jgi:hypothetical protein
MRGWPAILFLACAAVEPTSAPLSTPRLVEVRVDPSRGPDDPPRSIVRFEGESIDHEAIAFVPRFRDGAALIDPDRRVYEVMPAGERRMLAAGASVIAASDDASLIAYTIGDVLGELRTHDGTRERTIASGLASIGVLRVLEDRVAFVGAAPGGIAGVWYAPLDGSGARCVSNCDLRVGTDWRARFVGVPSAAETFELRAQTLAWRDHDGVAHEAPR